MPKAKKTRNVRQTKAVLRPNTKRLKSEGRPKGTLKKFRFEETKLGFMLKHETPLEYNLLMNSIPYSPFPAPPVYVIEVIAKASPDPSFRKKKFFRYLEDYRINGLYCKRGKQLTPHLEVYYKSIREKKLSSYIKRNKKKLKLLKSNI